MGLSGEKLFYRWSSTSQLIHVMFWAARGLTLPLLTASYFFTMVSALRIGLEKGFT